jgi:hypothetical protein
MLWCSGIDPGDDLFMRGFSLLIACFLMMGCWVVVLPIGPVVRWVQGPRLCVAEGESVGNTVRYAGRVATITKLHGVDDSSCRTAAMPLLVSVSYER